jgi:hypothetical protein
MAKKRDPIFSELISCDQRGCPAHVRGIYQRKGTNLILTFCQHHFVEHQKELNKQGFEVIAKDGVLVG